jgi:hypothetical protein
VMLALASIVIGYLMFRFIEQPFRHSSKSHHTLSKAGFGLACTSFVLVLTLPAATVWANAGWTWRSELPKDLALQLKDSKQFHIDQYGGAGFSEPSDWISGGKLGVADIVVIGDSHAAQYKTGFKELIGEPYKKNIYFSTESCLILPGMTRLTPAADWDSFCSNVLNNALQVLKKSPNAVLVLAESWDGQIPVAAYLDSKKPLLDPGEDLRSGFVKLIPKLDELKRLIGERKLIVIGGVPGAGVSDVMGCFMRPKYLHYDCGKILVTPKSERTALIGNSVLAQYAHQSKDIYFLNPFDALCNDTSCRSINDRHVLYSDDSHLSKEGSRYVVGYFRSWLLSKLAGS